MARPVAADAVAGAHAVAEPRVGPGPNADPARAADPGPAPVDAEDVPPEERPLDPRAIARASLAAGRNASLFWTLGGVAASVGAAFLAGAAAGAYALAGLLVVFAVVRAVLPSPGPAAVTVRAKGLDLTVLLLAAAALATLASIAPTG
ncbi:DUF3017 domain-containing protein [Cellulomonas sp. JZ18]|nr:DUF3017 domain-containing protein [Cellulomonas sp. JZ18]